MLPRPLGLIAWLCLATAPVWAQGPTNEHYADATGALGVAKGPAATVIHAELTRRNQDCTGTDFKPRRCALADNALNADVHYGVDGNGRRIAFVSLRWQSDPTGNAVEAKGLVFIAEADQPFRRLGMADVVGDTIADVRFEPGRITYATTYLRPSDARAMPTGRRRYELPLRPDGIGPVAIQRTGLGSAPTPAGAAPHPDAKQALAIVQSLYEAGEAYDRIFAMPQMGTNPITERLLSPSLIMHIRTMTALSNRCPIYDGDPRLGGAQGSGGPDRMRYAVDVASSAAERMLIRVAARQKDNKGVVNQMVLTLITTPQGWRVDDIAIRGGKSYRAALTAADARCRDNGG